MRQTHYINRVIVTLIGIGLMFIGSDHIVEGNYGWGIFLFIAGFGWLYQFRRFKGQKEQPKDIKKITGWPTMEEYQAYEKGREDEQELVMKWIAAWDGHSNSGLGALINAKITALTNGDFEPIDTNQTLIL